MPSCFLFRSRQLQDWITAFVPCKGLFENKTTSEVFCLTVVHHILRELKEWTDANPHSSIVETIKRWWRKIPSNLLNWYRSDSIKDDDDDDIFDRANILNVFAGAPRKTTKTSPLIDLVIFQFPDTDQKQFIAYHIVLSSWMSIAEANPLSMETKTKVKLGAIGEYHMRRFDVRDEFVQDIKEALRKKCIAETTDFLRKCKNLNLFLLYGTCSKYVKSVCSLRHM